jgi:hypothetical protein
MSGINTDILFDQFLDLIGMLGLDPDTATTQDLERHTKVDLSDPIVKQTFQRALQP